MLYIVLDLRGKMMGDILAFEPKAKKEDPIVLLDNIDVAYCLWAVNMFGVQFEPSSQLQILGPKELLTLRSEFIRDCLDQALQSDMLTDKGKGFITKLLTNNIMA